MSFVIAQPDFLAAAATDLANIGSAIGEAHATALAPTTEVLAAGADEISAAVAALFGSHAQSYQALGAEAAAFHQRFVQALGAGAGAYASTEAANASPLQTVLQELLGVINAPTETLLQRPLIGNGTNGAPKTGQNGGAGGILWGNGGSGGSGAPAKTAATAGPPASSATVAPVAPAASPTCREAPVALAARAAPVACWPVMAARVGLVG